LPTSKRADILFCDKDMGNIKISRLITRQIRLIEQLYGVFEKCEQQSGLKTYEIAR